MTPTPWISHKAPKSPQDLMMKSSPSGPWSNFPSASPCLIAAHPSKSAPIPLPNRSLHTWIRLFTFTLKTVFFTYSFCVWRKAANFVLPCGSIYVHSAFYPLPKKVSDKYLNCLKCFNLVFWDVCTLHITELSDPFLYFIASNASNYGKSLVKIKTIKFSQ